MVQRMPILVFAATLILVAAAPAATITSSQSGNWSNPATWGGGPVPGAGDVVIVDGGFTVTVDVSNAECLGLQLGGTLTNSGNGLIAFSGGSHLTVAGPVTIGVGNRQGSITMTSGGTLTCEGFVLNSLGTWTPGTGTVELTATNSLPNNGVTSFNNLTANGGVTTLNSNISVAGDLLINTGATIDGGVSRQLTLTGNWTNNGIFSGNTGTVIFNKNGNQSITGTGTNAFNLIRVNMGTSNANTLEVLASNFSAPDGFLTLSNGTFKISGSFTFSSTFLVGPIYNIQPSTGLWINNPNVTVIAQAGGVSVRGKLRVSAGTYNVGTSIDHSLDYVAGSSITIEGGSVNIAGRLCRNSPSSTTAYSQSGGTVTVVTQGSTDVVFAGFDLGAAGSSFTMSGGTLVVRNATSNATDLLNLASTSSVTGGTVQFGDASTHNAQTFRIQSSPAIGSLLISNATPQAVKPTAELVTSGLNVLGDVTIQPGTTLNANGLTLSAGGNWFDGGAFLAGPLVTFNGTGQQDITAASGETFNGLTVNKSGGTLNLVNPVTVNGGFSLAQGTIAVGSSTLTLNGVVSGSGTLTSLSSGTVQYGQGSDGQNVLAGSYGNLSFNGFAKVLPAAGVIGIAATFAPGSAAGHTVTGSSIMFNGAAQTVPAFTYNTLTLAGSGTKTASGPLTVGGGLTVAAGITLAGQGSVTLSGTTNANLGTINVDTLSVNSGATLTNNGTITVGKTLTGSGTFAQGASGKLNLGGTTDIATLSVSASGNTVNYTGNGQTVRSVSYHHLTLSGTGTPVLAGVANVAGDFTLSGSVAVAAGTGMTIGGNLSIGPGTSFDAGSFSHSLGGNWTGAGTFTAGTSIWTLSGTSPQTVGGSSFNILVLNNSSGCSLSGDIAINGSLTLSSGQFSIGSRVLTLNGALVVTGGTFVGGASSNLAIGGTGSVLTLPAVTLNTLTLNRTSGCALAGDLLVLGTLQVTNGILTTGVHAVTLGPSGSLQEPAGQPVLGTISTSRGVNALSGVETFGNIGVDITLNGVAPGLTTIVRKTGTASTGSGHSSILRTVDITPAVNSGLNAGLVFHYDSTELGGQNPAAFDLYRSRDGGTTWNNQGGVVNAALRTVSISGVNDFSRWTASDTSNRIGLTAAPAVAGISPQSKNAGDSAFTLTVNGTDFINGISTVRFNGAARPTVYVSTTRLTAAIPASDLRLTGSYPVTVVNSGGGGLSNAQPFVVTPGQQATVGVETAADGSGSVVPAQTLSSGSSLTVYAITRDALHNFVANVSADAWSLQSASGGVSAADLVPSGDHKSATFTARLVGRTSLRVTSGALASVASDTITVIPGKAHAVGVETFPDGTGTAVPAESLTVGSSLTMYAVLRDSLGNFVSGVASDGWSLQNITGSVVAGDLVPSLDNRSAVFTAHGIGSAGVRASSGSLTAVPSGTITVVSTTGVTDATRPLVYDLKQNYPNPFNPSTVIAFDIPFSGDVSLEVYDIIGRKVAELASGVHEAGHHSATWNAAGQSSGVYFVRLQALAASNPGAKFVAVRKMVLLK